MTHKLELAGPCVFVRGKNETLVENRLTGRIGIIRQRNRVISPNRIELGRVVNNLWSSVVETLKRDPKCHRYADFKIADSAVTLDLANHPGHAAHRLLKFWAKAAPLLKVADIIFNDVQRKPSNRDHVKRFIVEIGHQGRSRHDPFQLSVAHMYAQELLDLRGCSDRKGADAGFPNENSA